MSAVEGVLWLTLAAGWFAMALAFPRLRRRSGPRSARRPETDGKPQDPTTHALARTIETGVQVYLFLLGLAALLPVIEMLWSIPRQTRLDLARFLSQTRLVLLLSCGLAAIIVEWRR